MRYRILKSVCLVTFAICLLAPINAATNSRPAGSEPEAYPPIKQVNAPIPKIVRAKLPFDVPTVTNAAKTLPLTAMMPTTHELNMIRGFVPGSISSSPDLPKACQVATSALAKTDYEQEQSDRITQIFKGDPTKKQIALTFDDGPHGAVTLLLLHQLQYLNVPATFFVVGKQAVKFPQIVQLEVLDGNEVGNHTYDHVNLTKIPPAEVPYELDECDAVIQHIIGTSPRFFRPPGGDINDVVAKSVADHGYIIALWSEDPGDYQRIPSFVILRRCMTKLKPGVIFLLHDGVPQTVQMLPKFVAQARAEGYTFVTMSTLAGSGKPQAWP
jgi:peptidoglycan/xylan/chitin deacetylase (PgdA/CDA1 family)